MIILLSGLSRAGKSTLAQHVKNQLSKVGINTEIIDGDEYRTTVCKDVSFSKADRIENIKRLGIIAGEFAKRKLVAIISAMSPYQEWREQLNGLYEDFKIVHVDCPLSELVERDTKGLYKRALLPEGHPDKIYNLTGINDQYEMPLQPDLYLNTYHNSLPRCIHILSFFIVNNYYKEPGLRLETLSAISA